jgi:hypothetical protein
LRWRERAAKCGDAESEDGVHDHSPYCTTLLLKVAT